MDDAALVAAVRRGDLSAYASLYAAHVGAVRTTVRSQVSDGAMVDDVVQDVFVRALESLPRLEDAARFRPWLLSIARHTAVDARRGLGRLPELDEAAASSAVAPERVGPEDVAEAGELAALVWSAVAALSARDATAMAMVGLGFGISDVAGALGVSHGAAKVAVHRARERARNALLVEVLVRRHGPHCAEVDPSGDVVEVARHLRACAECEGLARAALERGR